MLCYPPLLPTNSVEELEARDDRDNSTIPIGMYILAAAMRERGHDVQLSNFALTPWDRALAQVERLSTQMGQNGLVARLGRAEIFEELGRPSEALTQCLAVIDREPRATQAHELAATILLGAGRSKDAEALAHMWS